VCGECCWWSMIVTPICKVRVVVVCCFVFVLFVYVVVIGCLFVLSSRLMYYVAMLHHCPTYGALLHDILHLQNNRVSVTVDGKSHTYDLDTQTDAFWRINKALPWTGVGAAVKQAQEQLSGEKRCCCCDRYLC
jgi:hypothetical protein